MFMNITILVEMCITQNMCTITNFLYLILSAGPENILK